MVQFSKDWAIALSLAMVPTIWKPDHSKSGHFCSDFNWFLTKWRPFVRIKNGWASRFQISDPIQNLDLTKTDHFSTVLNPELSRFQIPTVIYISYKDSKGQRLKYSCDLNSECPITGNIEKWTYEVQQLNGVQKE